MKALTIKQPWGSLIACGFKDVENREWSVSYRGGLLIHAGKAWDDNAPSFDGINGIEVSRDALPAGGIIARVQLVDVVTDSDSVWAVPGQFHWILADVQPVTFTPCRGMLGLWEYGDPDTPAPAALF